jgi:hypothetical protein
MAQDEQPREQPDTPLIELKRYPNLRFLTWQLHQELIREDEAFAVYEREWRHIDVANLTTEEQALIDDLTARYGNGVLNV